MKKIILAGAVATVVVGSLLPFNIQHSLAAAQASVSGRVAPSEGADMIWLIGAGDSVKANVAFGNFSALVKPGTYKLIVDAKSPYRDAQLDNLEVKPNQLLDVGEIILQK